MNASNPSALSEMALVCSLKIWEDLIYYMMIQHEFFPEFGICDLLDAIMFSLNPPSQKVQKKTRIVIQKIRGVGCVDSAILRNEMSLKNSAGTVGTKLTLNSTFERFSVSKRHWSPPQFTLLLAHRRVKLAKQGGRCETDSDIVILGATFKHRY